VTTVERTIVDLSIAGASMPRVDAWLDHLAADRALRVGELSGLAEGMRRRGKRRPTSLAVALAKRMVGDGVEQSRLERLLTAVVVRAGIGTGVAQYRIPDGRTRPSWSIARPPRRS
jgi:hypothetical protein